MRLKQALFCGYLRELQNDMTNRYYKKVYLFIVATRAEFSTLKVGNQYQILISASS
jgi:hypothetical protein